MLLTLRTFKPPCWGRTTVALAIAAVCGSAVAAPLPTFTFDPAAVGLVGVTFTGDNLLISDFSTVTFGAGNTFTDTGYLAVSSAQLAGATFTPTGLNSTYGMYFAFTGTGTLTAGGNPATAPTLGSFSTLTYTLYGYNGAASFGFSGNTPTETASGEMVLATGSLINGRVSTVPTGNGTTFVPSAFADLSFNAAADKAGFFKSPSPFYNLALTAFTNTTSQVEAFDGGFRIRQGGGSVNFGMTPAIPEPQTYLLMLAGLSAVGFVVRRRRQT